MSSATTEFGRNNAGLIAVIGDEDTVSGFLLTGIGHRDKSGANFLVVDFEKVTKEKVTEFFKGLVGRKDVALILINNHIAEAIRPAITAHTAPFPTVLEVPSKDHPYDEATDSLMIRVKRLLGGTDDS